MTPVVFITADAISGELHSKQVWLYFFVEGSFAYLAVLLFGVPAYLLYRTMRWTSVISFVLGGSLIGFLVSYLLLNLYGPVILFILAGALSALTFRLLLPVSWLSTPTAE